MQPGSSAIFLQVAAQRIDLMTAMGTDLNGKVIDLDISEDVQIQVNETAAAARRATGGMDHLV